MSLRTTIGSNTHGTCLVELITTTFAFFYLESCVATVFGIASTSGHRSKTIYKSLKRVDSWNLYFETFQLLLLNKQF